MITAATLVVASVSRAKAVLTVATVALVVSMAPAARSEASVGGRVLLPAEGATVRAGEVVTVRWEPLPGGVEEFELLLLVDESSDRSLRLTEMMEPGLALFTWLVPDLPCSRARLQVRYRLDGREVEAVPGDRFEIVGNGAGTPVKPVFRDGEWWLTAAPGLWPTEIRPRSEGLEAAIPLPWAGWEAAEGASVSVSSVGGGSGACDRLPAHGSARVLVAPLRAAGPGFVSRPQRE